MNKKIKGTKIVDTTTDTTIDTINEKSTNTFTGTNDYPSQSEIPVTTKQFLEMIMLASNGGMKSKDEKALSEYIDYALHKGIITDYDIAKIDSPIERRATARIVHEVLLHELGEKDEDEWSAANDLKDLYNCRTCVIHIAQMYVKGIMLSREDDIFDVKGNINYDEAQSIIIRMLDKEQRIPRKKGREFKVEKLSPDEARKLVLNDKTTMIVDVRFKEEYDRGHIEGSICIPLQKIINNPFSVSVNMNTPIILYCNMEYKSTIAAELMIDAGYSRIYTIPGIEEYKY